MKKGAAPIAIGIVILICLLAGLNLWQSHSTPSSSDDDDQQTQQQTSQQASKSAPNPNATDPVAHLTGDLVTSLVPEQTIGNPATAKTRVTVGYTFDTATQTDPSKAAAIVGALQSWAQKQGSAASLQIVCVDLPPNQLTNPADASVPLGVTIDGKQPPGMDKNPGEGSYDAQAVLKDLGGS